MDRAYIDYRVFEQFTQKGVFYVTKMKENQRFKQLNGSYMVNDRGLVVLNDSIVEIEKDEIKHTSRRLEYWEKTKKHSTILLTNNFDLDPA